MLKLFELVYLDSAEDVSGDNKTMKDSNFYVKYASLDVTKIAAKIVFLCVNRLILIPKLKHDRQKNIAVILLKKLTFQWY